MNKAIFTALAILLPASMLSGKDYRISSPDSRIVLTVNIDREISWSVMYENKTVVMADRISMILADGTILGEKESVRRPVLESKNELIRPVVAYKNSEIRDTYTSMTLAFRKGFSLVFRAYNDGIAYRFETSMGDSIIVKNEVSDLRFTAPAFSWFPLETSFMSHNEVSFIYSSLDTISSLHLASLPALFSSGGVNVLVTEVNIEDYPGMWLRGAGEGLLSGTWPAYPDAERLRSDRNLYVTGTRDYIAKTGGTRSFPWRVFIVSQDDGGLVESDMVYRLANPCRIDDTDWIKPGKVAWDWWNALNIYGVDFKAGINNETYKYYIDFAAENGLDYIILDEGWYRLGDVLDVVPAIDVESLCRYAESKNVDIILWVVWKSFYDRMDEALAQYEEWGVKGVKVDFMQRDDQKMVNFYYEAARKCADHKMLVDFHGAYKPDGMQRTYPNVITREGVKGLEHSKWSRDVSPEHNVTLPFTRMVAGPMDYTPGAMVNMNRDNFQPVFNRPASQGTRAHQMALYVVFESPLQMLADSPSNYKREQECTDFIAEVPVVWDKTRVLQAKVGDYILMARKKGNDWYIAGITDWSERDLDLDLSFLGEGTYTMEIFEDGVNADRYAEDYRHMRLEIRPELKMQVHLAPGGGWIARVSPAE